MATGFTSLMDIDVDESGRLIIGQTGGHVIIGDSEFLNKFASFLVVDNPTAPGSPFRCVCPTSVRPCVTKRNANRMPALQRRPAQRQLAKLPGPRFDLRPQSLRQRDFKDYPDSNRYGHSDLLHKESAADVLPVDLPLQTPRVCLTRNGPRPSRSFGWDWSQGGDQIRLLGCIFPITRVHQPPVFRAARDRRSLAGMGSAFDRRGTCRNWQARSDWRDCSSQGIGCEGASSYSLAVIGLNPGPICLRYSGRVCRHDRRHYHHSGSSRRQHLLAAGGHLLREL